MYHYVRPVELRWSERHHALDLEEFARQLDYLQATHDVISAVEIIELAHGERKRSPSDRPLVWLTFDDGYSDCARHVLPELQSRGLTASFLVPTAAIWTRSLLDVNAIHLLLSLAPSVDSVVSEIHRLWRVLGITTRRGECFEAAFRRLGVANARNDSSSEFVKKILQKELHAPARTDLLDRLLKNFVGSAIDRYVDELYLTKNDLCRLENAGMDVGSHGHAHQWLAELDSRAQRLDLEMSLRLLDEAGLVNPRRVMSYPFGSYNDDTIDIAANLGITCGLVNHDGMIAELNVGRGPWLRVSRIDPMFFGRIFPGWEST
jgi:peptidoglycan/xylan/chitin deacetylase (PgdA/CDA1 family)